MIRVCSACQKLDMPCMLGEKEPYHDLSITHGLCERHLEVYTFMISAELRMNGEPHA